MTNCATWDHKVYFNYLLCYGNGNSIMKFRSNLEQLSLKLGNDIVKELCKIREKFNFS